MEFRIDRALLGAFSEADGIMIGHFNIGPSGRNFLAPGDAVRNSPATWPRMTYGDASAVLPTAQITGHVFDGDRTRPVAGHQVDLLDADTGGAALYTRFTTVDGAFSFTVPVPAGRRLRV